MTSTQSPSFLPQDRPVLIMIGSTVAAAMTTASGGVALNQLLAAHPELVNEKYKELKLLQLLMNAKKALAISGEVDFRRPIQAFEELFSDGLPDPVFKSLINAMKQNPNRRDVATGLKVEVASLKVVEYVLYQLVDATNYFSHPMKELKVCFMDEPPFSPIEV